MLGCGARGAGLGQERLNRAVLAEADGQPTEGAEAGGSRCAGRAAVSRAAGLARLAVCSPP